MANVLSMQRAISVEFIRNSGAFAVKANKGDKNPAKGWDPRFNNKAKSAQTLADIEYDDCNIGAHLHGHIVDVDVDGTGAEEWLMPALDRFLPDCPHIWGRKSRPRTHRVYMVKGDSSFDPASIPLLKGLKKIEEVKVEVRGGPSTRGEYSLLPGSVHPSGEAYEWADPASAKASLAVVELKDLLAGIRKAGATTVLGPHWVEGIRQELTMSLAGFLHRVQSIAEALPDVEDVFYLDAGEAKSFIGDFLDLVGDDKSDRYMRMKAFDATMRKAQKGLQVYGATNIGNCTGDSAIVRKLYTLLTDSPDIAAIEEFSSRFVIWQGPALAVDMELLKAGENRPFMSRHNFINSYGHHFVEMGGKRRLLPEVLWSLTSATRVTGLTFDPSTLDSIVHTPKGDKINEWSGFDIQPAESATSEEVQKFTTYLRDVVCSENDDYYAWVLAWCADIFQRPSEKSGTALVLVGEEGAGKSILGHEILGKIIGHRHYATSNTIDNVTRNFNSLYSGRLLVQCDEAMTSRQKSQAARMKSLITDPTMSVEPKGVDAYFLPNHTRFFFTSNELEDAVYLSSGHGDRRYTVIEVSESYRGQVINFWEPFVRWLQEPGTLAKIHRYLLDHKYDKSLIRRPLSTEAKSRMEQASWEPFDAWLAAMLSRGHPLDEESHVKPYDAFTLGEGNMSEIDRTDWPTHVNMSALLNDYRNHVRRIQRRDHGDMNEVHLSMAMDKRGLRVDREGVRLRVKEFDQKTSLSVTKRMRVYPAPDRERIEMYLGHRYGFYPKNSATGNEIEIEIKPGVNDDF